MTSDRLGELPQRLGVEARADLLVRRPNLVDRDHLRDHRVPFARHRDEGVETAAQAANALLHCSNSSFARARYAAAPRQVGSYWSTDLP